MPHSGPSSTTDWYSDGLRFECTQCGNCCTGPPGAVWFDDDEARAMATHFGLSVEAFRATYAHRIDDRWSLIERETEHGFDCIFLDRTSMPGKALCSIYKTRPMQCRTWPFWPEILESRRSWTTFKRTTPCPGMDHGPLIPAEQVRIVPREDANMTAPMPPTSIKNAIIDGVACTLEPLADGSIRVTHETAQVNAMHGGGTGGEVSYIVHPAQRINFEFINNLLPADQRLPMPGPVDPRPWWSYAGGPRDKPDKDDASE